MPYADPIVRRAYARAYYRRYYKERADQRQKLRDSSRTRAARQRTRLDAIRRELGCIDCGRRDGLLHFDHRPGTIKLFTIGDRVALKWERIEAEIAKCDVRCHSCHSKRHNRLRKGKKVSAARRAKQRLITQTRTRDPLGRFLPMPPNCGD